MIVGCAIAYFFFLVSSRTAGRWFVSVSLIMFLRFCGLLYRLRLDLPASIHRRFVGETDPIAVDRKGMLGGMTASTAPQAEPNRPHRIYKLAALVVIVAGIVFIFAVVFWTGLMIGAHNGGHHRHHGGWKHSHESSMIQNSPSATTTPATTTPAARP